MDNNTQLFRWVNASERSPTKNTYYFVLRSGSSPEHIFQAHSGVHFWYAEQKAWSSKTDYWLEEYIPEVQEEEIIDRERKAFAEGIGIGIAAQKEITPTTHSVKDVEGNDIATTAAYILEMCEKSGLKSVDLDNPIEMGIYTAIHGVKRILSHFEFVAAQSSPIEESKTGGMINYSSEHFTSLKEEQPTVSTDAAMSFGMSMSAKEEWDNLNKHIDEFEKEDAENEEFVWGEEVEVSDGKGNWSKRYYVAKNPKSKGHITATEEGYVLEWEHIRKLTIKIKITPQMIADAFKVKVDGFEMENKK